MAKILFNVHVENMGSFSNINVYISQNYEKITNFSNFYGILATFKNVLPWKPKFSKISKIGICPIFSISEAGCKSFIWWCSQVESRVSDIIERIK